ncbi:MAG: anion permease [Chitinispirillaceae bacterium]|nr:anion permease [Chitinispirillaceae bacterium]
MELLFAVLSIVASIAVGWSIGANDAANSIGTAVGSKAIKLTQAIVIVSLFGFLGAYFQGCYVTKTIGKGIVAMDKLDRRVAVALAICASFSACAWVAIATYWKMPISTSHSMVGAVAGGGMAIGTPVAWKVLGNIFICWVLTPLGGAVIGFIIYWILKQTLHHILSEAMINRIMTILVVLSGCYMAFTWGANDVANATGVCSGAGILSPKMAVVVGALAILFGILTWGHKVIETVGTGMVNLVPIMAFSAQFASALNVQLYTLLGIPVSTSHSVVGAVFGVGLVKGIKTLNMAIVKDIVICWVATPFVSGVISFLLLKFIPWF